MDSAPALLPDLRERRTAAALHLATIFAPLIAPAVGWALSGRMPFVRAHARRSLVGALALQASLFVLGAISIAYSAWSLYGHYRTGWEHFSIWPILIKAAAVWVLLAILELINTLGAIRNAVRAYAGQ